MAQVDKLNYFPNLVWFLLLFLLFYSLIFSFVVPLIFSSLKTRKLFLNKLLIDIKVKNFMLSVLNALYRILLITNINIAMIEIVKNMVIFFSSRYSYLASNILKKLK